MRYTLVLLLLLLTPALAAAAPATAEVYHEDPPYLQGVSRFRTYVRPDSGGRFLVRSSTQPDERVQHGDRVWATPPPLAAGGRKARSGGLSGWTITPLMAHRTTLGASITEGTFKTLIMMVNFTNDRSQPITRAALLAWLPGVTEFYREVSYGRVALPIDVTEWLPLPMASSGCPYSMMETQAKQAATAAGHNLAQYSRHVVFFPYVSACAWGGLGSVGGNPSSAWINGHGQLGVLDHELGHNFGLYHSHALLCGRDPGQTPSIMTPPCEVREYGDLTDVMGGGGGHFNPAQKETLGWLGTPGMPGLTRVDRSGTHTLESYWTPGLGRKALKIPRPSDAWYLAWLAPRGTGWKSGVHLYLGGFTRNSYSLLDATPDTIWGSGEDIPVGRMITDPVTQTTIRLVSVTAAGAVVDVQMAGAPPPPPDRDGDGVVDATDQCPDVKGVAPTGCPVVTPPGTVGENSITFVLTSLAKPLTLAVPVDTYECVRQTGGSSFLRVYRVSGTTRTLLKPEVGVPNPVLVAESDGVKRARFTVRCAVSETQVRLYLSGVLKVTVLK